MTVCRRRRLLVMIAFDVEGRFGPFDRLCLRVAF